MGVISGGVMMVEAGKVMSQDQLSQDQLLQGLWGDTTTTCRAMIIDLTGSNNSTTHTLFR